MIPLYLTATTIVTALGRGEDETFAALSAGRSGLAPCDFADTPRHGFVGRVAGLDNWQPRPPDTKYVCRNNNLADMALRDTVFMEAVASLRARYGAGRIATVLGTSTSGILQAEEAYRGRDTASGALPESFHYDHTYDLFSLSRYVSEVLELRGPAMTVSTACASSARSFIDAHDLIAAGMADAAIVGGTDSLCRLTLHGFAALDLIAAGASRPCDAARDGISIGEAAAFAILERAPRGAGVALTGFGASSDGYHISSPRPDGTGAARAMLAALAGAGLGPRDIDYVNLHGTGTPANDAMENAAIMSVFGAETPCSSTKGYTGHTMGSCGIVEAVIAKICIERGYMPRCGGMENLDPAFTMQVLDADRHGPVQHVLSNSCGFGGINCSLIFGAA